MILQLGQVKPVKQLFYKLELSGAGGRNRTDTRLPSRDFESRASTNFTTPAPYNLVWTNEFRELLN